MTNKKTNLIIICYLFIAWTFPLLKNGEWEKFAFIIIYGAFISVFSFVKAKHFHFVSCICIALIVCYLIYNNTMLFLFINPLFITAEYISVFKGRKSETSTYFGANISATIGLFCLVYLYFKNIGEELSFIHLSSFPIVFAIFLFLLLVVAMVCLKTNKGTVEQYRMSAARFQHIKYLHIMNIVCYLESIIFFCLSHRGLQEFYERAYFFPWLIYIVVMLSVKDPFVDIMIKKSISVINRKSIK